MIDTLLKAIAPVLPWVFVTLVLFTLFAAVYLFKKLSGPVGDAETTRRALDLELSFFARVIRLGRRKTDPVAAVSDPNTLTISRPIPAVPPPVPPTVPPAVAPSEHQP